MLGWTANTETAQDIIHGKTPKAKNLLHPDLVKILPFLSKPPNTNSSVVDHCISENEYNYHLSKCNKFTSPGPSTIHYGHWKASCRHPMLRRIDATFLELSLQYGIILDRWCSTTDVMIPKKADSFQVKKLRTIMLFEHDWNLMNKIIAKRTMQLAESNSSIAKEQYGSRKQKSAIMHACNKQILFDLIRERKINASLTILDALSCYDSVAIPFAAICLQRQGTTPQMVHVMFITLSQMKHFIRTSFGDSKQAYTQTTTRFHGIGQGNGAGPMVWVMVSSPILESLRSHNCGINISSTNDPSGLITAFTFVDDNDMVQEIHSESDISRETQNALDIWTQGLHTSGGSCAPEKSSWTTIIHQWKNDKWSLLLPEEIKG